MNFLFGLGWDLTNSNERAGLTGLTSKWEKWRKRGEVLCFSCDFLLPSGSAAYGSRCTVGVNVKECKWSQEQKQVTALSFYLPIWIECVTQLQYPCNFHYTSMVNAWHYSSFVFCFPKRCKDIPKSRFRFWIWLCRFTIGLLCTTADARLKMHFPCQLARRASGLRGWKYHSRGEFTNIYLI